MAQNQSQSSYPITPSVNPLIPSWLQNMDPNSAAYKEFYAFIQNLPLGVDINDLDQVRNAYSQKNPDVDVQDLFRTPDQ